VFDTYPCRGTGIPARSRLVNARKGRASSKRLFAVVHRSRSAARSSCGFRSRSAHSWPPRGRQRVGGHGRFRCLPQSSLTRGAPFNSKPPPYQEPWGLRREPELVLRRQARSGARACRCCAGSEPPRGLAAWRAVSAQGARRPRRSWPAVRALRGAIARRRSVESSWSLGRVLGPQRILGDLVQIATFRQGMSCSEVVRKLADCLEDCPPNDDWRRALQDPRLRLWICRRAAQALAVQHLRGR
jgi:hypothetical protein